MIKKISGLFFALILVICVSAPITAFAADATSVTLGIGEKYQAEGPANSSETVKWTSSDKSIAAVSSKGVVTAKAVGKTTVTAVSGSKKAAYTVTVKKAPASVSAVILDFNKKPYVVPLLPSGTASKKITYMSTDTDIATVSASGMITMKKQDSCKIIVSTFNEKTYSVDVYGVAKNGSIVLDSYDYGYAFGEKGSYTYYAGSYYGDGMGYVKNGAKRGTLITKDLVMAYSAYFYNDKIYYVANTGNKYYYDTYDNIYVINADGTKKTQIVDEKFSDYMFKNGRLYYYYYLKTTSGAYLYRYFYSVNLDGSDKVKVITEDFIYCYFHDGYIYYQSLEDLYYMVKEDGTGLTKISKDTYINNYYDYDSYASGDYESL